MSEPSFSTGAIDIASCRTLNTFAFRGLDLASVEEQRMGLDTPTYRSVAQAAETTAGTFASIVRRS
jgi:hypothetical protein